MRGLLEAEWGVSHTNRRVKFYRLTPAGRRHLAAERHHWNLLWAGMTRVLESNQMVPMQGWFHSVCHRMRTLWHRRQFEQDLRDELAWHLEMRRENSAPQAPFGNIAAVQEECMEIRAFQFEGWLREAWQSARTLAKSPGSTIPVVALLALGIGGSTAVFSVNDALFLNALPVEEPEGLATISRYWSVPNFEDFRRAQTSFSGVFAVGVLQGTVVLEGGRQLDAPVGILASGNYFQVLGIRPVIGRLFTGEDDQFGNPQPAIVISSGFWRRQFGGRPEILGTRMYVSGSPFTIIGVTPPGFTGDTPGRITDFWAPLNSLPLAMPQGDRRRNHGFNWVALMGRLKRDVSLQQAQAEAQAIFERLGGQPARASRPARRQTIEVKGGMY